MVKFFVMSVVDLTVDGVQAVINLAQQYQELQQELLRAQQLQQEEEKDEELSLTDKSLYDFILDQSKIELRSDDVYMAVTVCCDSSLSDELPSTFDIAYEILTQKRCTCFIGQSMNAMILATEHALLHHSTTSCNIIAQVLMFHAPEHHYPTARELEQAETQLHAILDPAMGEGPVKQPCPGLEKLKSQKAKKVVPQGCCICQSDITRGSKIIKLTPCGHIFHDKTRNCDGIRPWLENNRTCPICIKNVEIV